MEILIRDGDYVPDGKGGFLRAEGAQELLQRVLFKLSARRGSFPFLPELGSELYRLGRERPSSWEALARQYAVQALQGEELEVTGVQVAPHDGGAEVTVWLDYRGQALAVGVEV